MDPEILAWFSNFLNFLIIAYISIAVVNTSCFNTFQLSLSLGGLLSSIFVNINSLLIRNN